MPIGCKYKQFSSPIAGFLPRNVPSEAMALVNLFVCRTKKYTFSHYNIMILNSLFDPAPPRFDSMLSSSSSKSRTKKQNIYCVNKKLLLLTIHGTKGSERIGMIMKIFGIFVIFLAFLGDLKIEYHMFSIKPPLEKAYIVGACIPQTVKLNSS